MKIEVELTLSQAYYQEVYQEWVISRSKYRRWQVHVGLLLCCLALLFTLLSGARLKEFWFFPLFFIVAGACEIGSFYYSSRQWLRSRVDSRLLDQQVALTFEPHVIHHTGPFSQGELRWEGIQHIQETTKGLFLIPQNGVSIYLPKSAFHSPVQVQEILVYAKQR
jgi:hypothetical protein